MNSLDDLDVSVSRNIIRSRPARYRSEQVIAHDGPEYGWERTSASAFCICKHAFGETAGAMAGSGAGMGLGLGSCRAVDNKSLSL